MKPGETYPESQQKQVVDWSFGPQKQMRNHCLPNKNKDFLDFFRYPFFFGILHKKTKQKHKRRTRLGLAVSFLVQNPGFFPAHGVRLLLDEPGGPGPVGVAQDDPVFVKGFVSESTLQGWVFFFKGFVGF